MSDETTSSDTSTDLNEETIADYLRDHPDFFIGHPGLLAELTLPHDSGHAVSLVERQVAILRERNMDMRHRLSKLLDNARTNDRLFEKTKRLVLTLLEGRDLGDIVDSLYYSFDSDFKIHFTTLILFGDNAKLPGSGARIERMPNSRDPLGQIVRNNKPVCGVLKPELVGYLFPKHKDQVGSVAIAPLTHGKSYGVLAVANRDPHHYRSSMGTLFLSYIAEILNRVLPQHLSR